MIKCPSCSTDNLDNSQYCDECGTALKVGRQFDQPQYSQPVEFNSPPVEFTPPPPAEYVPPAPVEYVPPPAPVEFNPPQTDYNAPPPPNFVSASVTSIGIPPIVDEQSIEPKPESLNVKEQGSFAPSEQNAHSFLLIERGTAVGAEFELTSDESYIGRWDADNGIFPDIDLDAHDPEAKVSRRHARIVRADGRFYIEDLGSTNGTFVNRGRRLLPGNRQPVEDGDEIIVGKTFLRFRINR